MNRWGWEYIEDMQPIRRSKEYSFFELCKPEEAEWFRTKIRAYFGNDACDAQYLVSPEMRLGHIADSKELAFQACKRKIMAHVENRVFGGEK